MGVSELYATALLMGVTLSLGSLVFAGATSQFAAASNSQAEGSALLQMSAAVHVSLAFAASPQSGGCPSYQGGAEGTTLVLGLYNYGTTGFAPAGFIVNSSFYAGSYPELASGALLQYSILLGGCAHASGTTLLAYDSAGDEVQLEA